MPLIRFYISFPLVYLFESLLDSIYLFYNSLSRFPANLINMYEKLYYVFKTLYNILRTIKYETLLSGYVNKLLFYLLKSNNLHKILHT